MKKSQIKYLEWMKQNNTSTHCRIKFKTITMYNPKKQTIMNIIGRLTSDAEVRTLSNEKQVVNFSIAVNDNYRNKQGERVELTEYFDCSYWISPNVAKILTKGTVVELVGRLSARAWLGNDGQAQAGLNFHTSQIKLHGGGRKSNSQQATQKPKVEKAVPDEGTDDLPF